MHIKLTMWEMVGSDAVFNPSNAVEGKSRTLSSVMMLISVSLRMGVINMLHCSTLSTGMLLRERERESLGFQS
jgi:hypothetical protein